MLIRYPNTVRPFDQKNIPRVPGVARVSLPDGNNDAVAVLPRRKAFMSASSSAEG